MKAKYLIKGIIRSIPGIKYVRDIREKTGGTCDARYCYSIWLRHLIYAYQNGFNVMPQKLAELGPGDSLGIGISALISGVEQYYALDIVKYSNDEVNLKIFDDLVKLFQQKTPIPDDKEFPRVKPYLKNYDFPEHIFPEHYLRRILDKNRLLKIRNSIRSLESSVIIKEDDMISYVVPWNETSLIRLQSLDMIISQAVLQHIDNLSLTYKSMSNWLKPNGLLSHEIDFKSMGSSDTWYGHWEYSDLEWKIIRGRKVFYINREPYSTHIKLLNDNNFKIIFDLKTIAKTKINSKNLAGRFKNSTPEDLTISSTFIQATKEDSPI